MHIERIILLWKFIVIVFLQVETHFQYLMTEASLDFTAKFAALAAEVSSESSQ